MVRTRIDANGREIVKLTREIFNTWGKEYTLLTETRTVNSYGELTGISETSTAIKGDLQHGPDIDQKLVERGIIQNGEGVFYTEPNQNTVVIEMDDILQDGSDKWQIVELIETGEWQGTRTHLGFKCIRYNQ